MRIKVNFKCIKKDDESSQQGDITSEMSPLLAVYSWKPKKGEAVMDFIAALTRYDHECVVEGDCEKGVKCMAVAGANGGAVLLANLSKQSVLLKLECDGMRIHKVRMIDNLRTDIVVPMLASLPPLSILLVECTTGKG